MVRTYKIGPNAGKKVKGGGWLNKVVPLVKAIIDEDWGKATSLASTYAEHPGLASLLAKQQHKQDGW